MDPQTQNKVEVVRVLREDGLFFVFIFKDLPSGIRFEAFLRDGTVQQSRS
jgi:hypothetical protein